MTTQKINGRDGQALTKIFEGMKRVYEYAVLHKELFSTMDVRHIFKELHINTALCTFMQDAGILKRELGKYRFVDIKHEPTASDALNVRNSYLRYMERMSSERKQKEVVQAELMISEPQVHVATNDVQPTEEDRIKEAIRYLKERGYRVMRQEWSEL
jgi:hypothetical protein